MLVVNIVIFLLNLMNLHLGKFEYFFNVLSTVLFVIAIALFLWWTIEYGAWGIWHCFGHYGLPVQLGHESRTSTSQRPLADLDQTNVLSKQSFMSVMF
ncbi:hypothetical protein M3Y98_00254900 [Aphelenchoides besseyi]|nr:hypothetical protein M3Y98_00254900 [Aphelenchoides besseyi]